MRGSIRRTGEHGGRGRRAATEAFTLIELMIVVAIVAILAMLAGYGVRKYVASSKTAEARSSVGRMSKDAATAYEKESIAGTILSQRSASNISRKLCGSATAPVPSSAAAIQGRKYQSKDAEWKVDSASSKGFACLKYTMDEPQYYMYSYGVAGSSNIGDSFTSSAQGDLNGDGVLSLFQLTGSISNGFVLNIAPNMLEVRPEE